MRPANWFGAKRRMDYVVFPQLGDERFPLSQHEIPFFFIGWGTALAPQCPTGPLVQPPLASPMIRPFFLADH